MIALLFPGQGSQKPGMMDDFIQLYPKAKELFQQTSEVIKIDCIKALKDEKQLNQTHITQPIILTSSYIIFSYLQKYTNFNVLALAGHSLGEYSALLVAGSISFTDAVKLVNIRGKLMQKAVEGKSTAMAAILGLDDETVITTCKELNSKGKNVSAVNFNCMKQVVIAGIKQDLEQSIEILKQKGAKRIVLLDVSVPSHCNLMFPIIEEFKQVLSDINIKQPNTEFYQNISACKSNDIEQIKQNLVNQIAYPVLWHKIVSNIEQENKPEIFIECGYNNIITNLNKKITKTTTYSTSNINNTDEVIEIIS